MAALLLAGCTGPSQVKDDGTTDEAVFPDIGAVRFDNRQGTFPSHERLRALVPGLSRDALYDLLGRPHFSEGFRVREWDYLFYMKPGDFSSICQLKVLFDQETRRARSYLWKPAGCADPVEAALAPTR